MKRFAHTRDRLSGTALTVWCVCLWLSVTSCSPTPKKPTHLDEPSPTLPTLSQIRSQLPQEAGSTGLLGLTPDGQLAAMMHVSQMNMPLHVSTAPAWALTDAQGLDPVMVDAWRANGLRVGLLKAADYEPFLQALPPRPEVIRVF